MISAITGTLCAATAKGYDFADRRTGERISGVSYRLFVVKGFDEKPVEVKCDLAMHDLAKGYGAGAQVEVIVEAEARDNKLVYSARGLNLVSSNGQVKVRA